MDIAPILANLGRDVDIEETLRRCVPTESTSYESAMPYFVKSGCMAVAVPKSPQYLAKENARILLTNNFGFSSEIEVNIPLPPIALLSRKIARDGSNASAGDGKSG